MFYYRNFSAFQYYELHLHLSGPGHWGMEAWLSILLTAFQAPGAKSRVDLRVRVLPTLNYLPVLLPVPDIREISIPKNIGILWRYLQILKQISCSLDPNICWNNLSTSGTRYLQYSKAHHIKITKSLWQSKEREDNRYYLCLFQPIKSPMILIKTKHKSILNKGISPIRMKLWK